MVFRRWPDGPVQRSRQAPGAIIRRCLGDMWRRPPTVRPGACHARCRRPPVGAWFDADIRWTMIENVSPLPPGVGRGGRGETWGFWTRGVCGVRGALENAASPGDVYSREEESS